MRDTFATNPHAGAASFADAPSDPNFISDSAPSIAPTARPATAAELAVFSEFAPTKSGWTMDEYAVDPPYALIGFYSANSGVTALLQQNASGAWRILTMGGGQITPETMTIYAPGMTADVAQSLYDLAVRQDACSSGGTEPDGATVLLLDDPRCGEEGPNFPGSYPNETVPPRFSRQQVGVAGIERKHENTKKSYAVILFACHGGALGGEICVTCGTPPPRYPVPSPTPRPQPTQAPTPVTTPGRPATAAPVSPATVAAIQSSILNALHNPRNVQFGAVVVVSNYAFANYYPGESGGQAVLAFHHGAWVILAMGGGTMGSGDLKSVGVPSATAAQLVAKMSAFSH